MPKEKEKLKKLEGEEKEKLKEKNVSKSDKKVAKKKETVKKSTKSLKETEKKTKKNSKVSKKAEETKKPTKSTKNAEKEYLQEYYDLPYRYNETIVKILAQTPKRLFVYWEISDKDRQTYLNAFGEDFFTKTYPVLLVHNEEMNYTFEVPINDFANSWYLDIPNPKTKYVVQLGRKFRDVQDIKSSRETIKNNHINLQNDFVYITDSNKLEAPNDHVLFESIESQVTYRNVKNGNEFKKDVSDITEKLGKSYKDANIEDIYKELYGEEISEDILSNPSSGTINSSTFK